MEAAAGSNNMMMIGGSPAGISTTSKCGAAIGKSPTRLQKHAPAALRLDEITTARNLESCLTSAACVIPLLSPLVLSPPLPQDQAEQRSTCITGGGGNVNCLQQGRIEQSVSTVGGGWQHPAAGAFVEPSTLFAFFQTQCSLQVQPTPTH
ncbi:hypothetical protein M9H77_15824 [Catharanthus roseus]|uniref:Uncharacterized protein n=1 Tax=Catharanthus roseus TaxID=4058 RepID=A0ACC0B145_CATRO|nr:hypothetical protein M9H77_15824 [Catharanthus roseus]